MGPPLCSEVAVPKKRPVPMTPPILQRVRDEHMSRRVNVGANAPDHGNVPVLELPLEGALRVYGGHLGLGVIVQMLLRDDLVHDVV